VGELPVKFVKGQGQGGGGAITNAELWYHMRATSDRPLVLHGSICHTDRAKAYGQLHRMTGAIRYGRLRLWRTWVRHSRKGNLPVQFCRLRRIILHDGSKVWRKGGTQKIDGYWALLRKEVARRGVTTERSELLRDMVFFHQFLYWQSANPIADAKEGKHLEASGKTVFANFCRAAKRRDATSQLYRDLEEQEEDGEQDAGLQEAEEEDQAAPEAVMQGEIASENEDEEERLAGVEEHSPNEEM
jgi:hypothetical protein